MEQPTHSFEYGNGNAEETINKESNSKLLEQIPIENSPFTAVKYENKWFLTLGKYRLSEIKETLKEVQEDAMDASWIRIMQIIKIMIQEDKDQTTKQ